ncbi:MAG TPA: flagellar motor protein MotB [Burkholderiales bacterium]|nr:flagellar motor protein MotB [Burkholderiales bacterium]
MQDESQRPIIVKRRKVVQGGAHGGAWKIAYADFVTAMMAFFLLMWLLGSTTKGDLQGIADYFKNPLRISMQGGSGAGDSSSVLKGGGKDLTRRSGEVNRGDIRDRRRPMDLKAAEAELEKMELKRLEQLKSKLDAVIDASAMLKLYRRQLLIDITSEGLRIQIVDEKNRPMFELGRADLLPHTRDILHEIGKVLNDVPNRVSLSGHTDATPYYGGERGYSNWELSADRANASRRELVAGGMREDKVMRVVGLSSAVLFDKKDPLNPINRRISIIVMKKHVEESVSSDGPQVDVGQETAPDAAALSPPSNTAPETPAPAPQKR